MKTNGTHVFADVWINEYPENTKKLIDFIRENFEKCSITVENELVHYFSESAFTAIWLLSESHFSIHTFPERNYISMDCYTCGNNSRPLSAISNIIEMLNVKHSKISIIERGIN